MPRDPMRRTLDAVERVVVLTLFVLLLYRFLQSAQPTWPTVVYLVGEGLVVLMLAAPPFHRSNQRGPA